MKIDKYIIYENQLIEDAIELIQFNHSRCVIIINNSSKVIGVISEGDILRAILKGISLKSSVKHILNTSFRYLTEINPIKIKEIFGTGITLIPILNIENELIDVVDFVEFFNQNQIS